MSHIRGGRTREQDAKDAQAAEAKEAREREQALADLRGLLPDPRFQRFALRWIGKAGTFAKPVRLFTAERNVLDGRRELGCEMWDEFCEASPSVVQLMLLPATVSKESPE